MNLTLRSHPWRHESRRGRARRGAENDQLAAGRITKDRDHIPRRLPVDTPRCGPVDQFSVERGAANNLGFAEPYDSDRRVPASAVLAHPRLNCLHQSKRGGNETLAWMYTAVVWHLQGPTLAHVYVSHVLLTQTLSTVVYGVRLIGATEP